MKTHKSLLSALLCSAAVMAAGQAAAQDANQVEEVVVTGSFIKRSEGFPSASPVDVLSREELAIRAPANLANFLADLPANFGSTFSTGRALGGGERGSGTINLRGLGNAATLVLMNGHRQTQVADSATNVIDVNSLVPDIMIERFEVLKDGASALYGTDAVAGVVNIITRDNFQGLRISAQGSDFTNIGKGDRNVQVLAGVRSGKAKLVGAFGFFDQDLISSTFQSPQIEDDQKNLRFTIDNYYPGIYAVPTRAANGTLTTATRRVLDPYCGIILGTTAATPRTATTLPTPQAPGSAAATTCTASFFDDNALQSGLRRYQGFLRGTYEFTDNLRFTGELGYSDTHTETTYTAGETLAVPITIPGHNPGNTFRAVNAAGQALYAVSSGVSAGYTRDGQTVFLPSRDAQGRVILTADPTNPASGIAFNEDVLLNPAAGRLLGSQCGLPTGNTLPLGACAKTRPSLSDNTVFTASGYFDGTVADNWDWTAGLTYSKYDIATNNTPGMALTSNLVAALNGLGGASCPVPSGTGVTAQRGQGNCMYFNPFGNSVFATSAGNPQANSQAVIDYVLPLLTDRYQSALTVAEARVSNGQLFALPAGNLGIAAGVQFRRAGLIGNYDVNRNNGNTTNLNTAADYDQSQNTYAVFGEVNVPLLKNSLGYLEAQGALRYEKIGGDLNTTNPKLGLLFTSDNGRITLRGSYGSSFVAPSLFQLYGNIGAGGALTDCPVTQNPVCTGGTNLRITQITTGNVNLKPQTSDAYSVGFTVKPFDGLTMSIDAWKYTFKDLITTEAANNVVRADPTGALTGKVIRNPATNQVAVVYVQYTNAAVLETQGIDFQVGYKRDLNSLGRIDLDLSGTYRDRYRVTPTVGATPIEGAGQTNGGGGRAPLVANPKWRANFRATWAMGPHSVNAILHYFGTLTVTEAPTLKVPTWTPIDISYTYNMDKEIGPLSGASFSIGANNVFDENASYVPYPGFQSFLPTLQDIRGRSVWARVAMNF
jgi:iron complex outermembrane receptor protein